MLPDRHATADRAQALVAQTRENTNALVLQIARSRLCLAHSKELLERTANVAGLPFYAAMVAPEAAAPEARTDGTVRTFAAVTELIERVEQTAMRDENLAACLIADIKLAICSETEPTLLMGILVEGIVQTLLNRVPREERRDMIVSLCTLLCDRVNRRSIGLE